MLWVYVNYNVCVCVFAADYAWPDAGPVRTAPNWTAAACMRTCRPPPLCYCPPEGGLLPATSRRPLPSTSCGACTSTLLSRTSWPRSATTDTTAFLQVRVNYHFYFFIIIIVNIVLITKCLPCKTGREWTQFISLETPFPQDPAPATENSWTMGVKDDKVEDKKRA